MSSYQHRKSHCWDKTIFYDRLISTMGLPLLVRWHLYIESGPCIHVRWRFTWWRLQMETVSALLVICAGNSPVTGELPAQRPETRGFDVFFDLCPDKRLSKQSRGWWFETPSHSLWRHGNVVFSDGCSWSCWDSSRSSASSSSAPPPTS